MPIREQLQGYVAAVIASTRPDETPPANVHYPDTSQMAMMGEDEVLGAILNSARRAVNAPNTNVGFLFLGADFVGAPT